MVVMVREVFNAGDLPGLSQWQGRSNSWGPDDDWKMWVGGDVINGVCDLLDQALESNRQVRSRHHWSTGVIAITPWFTHRGVADRLARLPSCLVIDKKNVGPEARRLAQTGTPIPSAHPKLWFKTPRDGTPDHGAPGRPDYDLGPVRVFGWNAEPALIHAKVVLVGTFLWYEDDEMYAGDRWLFRPVSVWWGSANLTRNSTRHLEVACWSDDSKLVEHFSDFVGDVLAASEPISSTAATPTSDLVDVDLDYEPDSDSEW